MEIFILFCKIISFVVSILTLRVYMTILMDDDVDDRENNNFFIANLFIEAIFAFTICYRAVNESAAINPLFEKLPFLVGLVVFNLPIKNKKSVNNGYILFRTIYHSLYHIGMLLVYILEGMPIIYFKINGILGLGVLLIMAFNCRKYSDEKLGKIKSQIGMYKCNEVDQKLKI